SMGVIAWLGGAPRDPNDPPDLTPGLTVENIKRRVNLSWKLASGGWTYNVLRSTTETGPFQPVATGLERTQFTEGNLEFGQRYFYRVVALNRNGVVGLLSAPVSIQPVDDTLLLPWKGTDIGDVGAEGSDGFLNDAFTLRGSGGDVWGNADAFHYVYQPVEGNWTMVVHIASQDGANEWAKAGLMVRERVDAGATDVFVFRAPGHGIVMQHRSDTGGGTDGTGALEGFGGGPWLRLSRRGDVFTSSVSKDGGQTWTEVGSITVSMPRAALVGMAVTSHSHGAMNRTVFDHVRVTAD
ncbi:MAG: hypothetical protein M3Y56_12090, partial [Armatimonadota bacterium]|nr:hypothetical protein [Armatimonadota bacterium]